MWSEGHNPFMRTFCSRSSFTEGERGISTYILLGMTRRLDARGANGWLSEAELSVAASSSSSDAALRFTPLTALAVRLTGLLGISCSSAGSPSDVAGVSDCPLTEVRALNTGEADVDVPKEEESGEAALRREERRVALEDMAKRAV